MHLKDMIRNVLITLHADITQNLKYDRLTQKVLEQVLQYGGNALDVGCHKGEILEAIIKLAPLGHHIGFEPIPSMFQQLQEQFSGRATILPFALSDQCGQTTFQYVKNAPAYSGIKKREYATSHPDIEEINVEMKTLDSIITNDMTVKLIKIDVEGAEYLVLKGALQTLRRHQPVVIFECGLGASDFYGTQPEQIFDLLTRDAGLKIHLINDWLKGYPWLSREEFCKTYRDKKEYYFVASAR
ncbi:MAG: FkbM family methyltransferase [Bacteroidales bacterium]|nr:FkbM family methyltransferase [Bacteroidales bacterium]MDD3665281.1 FkbM family methyltransferase [Bacteroidales bacterium]